MIRQPRARIYWFEAAGKWAVAVSPLTDVREAERFSMALRQHCRAVFNQVVRAWMVDEQHLRAAQQVVRKHYGHYELVERERAQPPPRPAPPPSRTRAPAYVVFCALVGCEQGTSLSYERARTLYRHAAARLHPDTGGSSEDMAALNVAWIAVRDLLT
jgi:hypothetical protein